MSKNTRHAKDNLFGMFIIISGIIVLGAVALTVSEHDSGTVAENSAQEVEEQDSLATGGTDEDIADELEAGEARIADSTDSAPPEATQEPQDAEETEDVIPVAEEVVAESVNFQLKQAATVVDGGEITSYIFGGNNIVNVMPLEMKSVVLAETGIKTAAAITVSGVEANRLTIQSAKDGSDLDIIQIEHEGTLYDVRGEASFLNSIEQYISFE